MDETIAVSFLEEVIKGNHDQAFASYVSPSGRHHNLWTGAGMDALKNAMKENDAKFPNRRLDIKQVVSQDPMVAVYSHLRLEQNSPGMAVMHMFRIEAGKIIEIWDCAQAIPEDSVNGDGAF